jgi:hypothetical protein
VEIILVSWCGSPMSGGKVWMQISKTFSGTHHQINDLPIFDDNGNVQL